MSRKMMNKLILLFVCCCTIGISLPAQPLNKKNNFTRGDTLRGTITPERAWWDVLHYTVEVTPDFETKTIRGKSTIQYKVVQRNYSDYIQIDLQRPLRIDSIFYNNKYYINYPGKPYYNEGNVWFIPLPKAEFNSVQTISFVYSGKPIEAKNPPWDGGWIWKKDDYGRPWMSAAVQGLGASAWYPCKDHQSDEPDNGARLIIHVPDSLTGVGNGKLINKKVQNKTATYTWEVTNPINNYNIIPYIGKYTNFTETFKGENGDLNCSYWVLNYNLEKAKKHFVQVKQTLEAFEHWFGPYPFYEDDFKLVESPHLGMEHQSAVAYGNKYQNGYLGNDLSGTGWGKKWDFIIVHEAGHEWFGNNITTKDVADMWVHEGFTSYSETLFTEFHFGKDAGNAYIQGVRKSIQNDKPIIGIYGVNQEGSVDMYPKAANMLHTIRQVINDDETFRQILRGLNKTFFHSTVTTKDVEQYISKESGRDFSKIFDQYLRTTKIPVLEVKPDAYRWTNCVEGFKMPVKLKNGKWISPVTEWTKYGTENTRDQLEPDPNFYIDVKKI